MSFGNSQDWSLSSQNFDFSRMVPPINSGFRQTSVSSQHNSQSLNHQLPPTPQSQSLESIVGNASNMTDIRYGLHTILMALKNLPERLTKCVLDSELPISKDILSLGKETSDVIQQIKDVIQKLCVLLEDATEKNCSSLLEIRQNIGTLHDQISNATEQQEMATNIKLCKKILVKLIKQLKNLTLQNELLHKSSDDLKMSVNEIVEILLNQVNYYNMAFTQLQLDVTHIKKELPNIVSSYFKEFEAKLDEKNLAPLNIRKTSHCITRKFKCSPVACVQPQQRTPSLKQECVNEIVTNKTKESEVKIIHQKKRKLDIPSGLLDFRNQCEGIEGDKSDLDVMSIKEESTSDEWEKPRQPWLNNKSPVILKRSKQWKQFHSFN